MNNCGGCKHLAVMPDADGIRRIRPGWVYPCGAPDPEISNLPMSVTGAFGFNWPPRRTKMEGRDGDGCPVFERRER